MGSESTDPSHTRAAKPPGYRPLRATSFGCLFALAVALVTGIMLMINGSIVMVVMRKMAVHLPQFMREPQFLQFVLFSVPVILAIGEWMVFDYLVSLFRRSETEPES